jgi:hypothetical protein
LYHKIDTQRSQAGTRPPIQTPAAPPERRLLNVKNKLNQKLTGYSGPPLSPDEYLLLIDPVKNYLSNIPYNQQSQSAREILSKLKEASREEEVTLSKADYWLVYMALVDETNQPQ